MPQQFTDGAKAPLTLSINTVATSLTVTGSLADLFPVANTPTWGSPLNWFKALLVDTTGAVEIIKVGVRAGGSGTLSNILRAQDGTTAKSFTAGSAYVVHGPVASDFKQVLAGIFSYLAAIDSGDPKLEVSKTGTGAAAAMYHMVSGKLTLAQSDGSGGVTADRITFDQTNGNLTTTGVLTGSDLALTSDERLKTGWKLLPRNFIARLAQVKHGIYRRKGAKRLEVGVSAQSLRELLPQAVHADAAGMLSVSYPQAALVAAIALADEVMQQRAAIVDLEAAVKRLERRK